MAVHLFREVEKLKKMILSLSALVEENVAKAVRAVIARDARLAENVIESDDAIDQMEVITEEECLKILALHQPVAFDLRFVIAVLKINNDLERIGDLAVNIAEQAVALAAKPAVESPFDLPSMAEKSQAMLKGCLDSLVNMDTDLAHKICASDDEVDIMHRLTYSKVQEGILRHPDRVELLIHYLSVSRYLERIADYATNVAEDVIYMAEGEIVRHKGEDHPHDAARTHLPDDFVNASER